MRTGMPKLTANEIRRFYLAYRTTETAAHHYRRVAVRYAMQRDCIALLAVLLYAVLLLFS
jgi:hypothetical protein